MRANGPTITHLMFADDLVLFAEAVQKNIDVILQCLQVFGDISGHRVSQDKTIIYFSPNVGNNTRREIYSRSGFKPVVELGRYLGAEIAFPRRGRKRRTSSGMNCFLLVVGNYEYGGI